MSAQRKVGIAILVHNLIALIVVSMRVRSGSVGIIIRLAGGRIDMSVIDANALLARRRILELPIVSLRIRYSEGQEAQASCEATNLRSRLPREI